VDDEGWDAMAKLRSWRRHTSIKLGNRSAGGCFYALQEMTLYDGCRDKGIYAAKGSGRDDV
jgi:hypothetical protein